MKLGPFERNWRSPHSFANCLGNSPRARFTDTWQQHCQFFSAIAGHKWLVTIPHGLHGSLDYSGHRPQSSIPAQMPMRIIH